MVLNSFQPATVLACAEIPVGTYNLQVLLGTP